MIWALVLVGIILLGLFLYWLLVTTEGVFLGQRMVIWLYDLTATRYDSIKEFNVSDDSFFIARPIMRSIEQEEAPLILDVATGTGRVLESLLREPEFDGIVIGLDASKRMLVQAKNKLNDSGGPTDGSYALIQQLAAPLPFPNDTFDLVCCLEALEFFPSDREALAEMVRVLKPGRTLLTSRRRGKEARLYLGRYRSKTGFEVMLRGSGLTDIHINQWELDYDIVTARKADEPVESTQ